jgi:exodeoxyribonuclease VII large subunit
MTLPLFPPADAGSHRTVTLVRLAAEIARSIASVGRISVEGEVHRPSRTGSGRVYFTLRDRAAQVTVMCPRAKVARCRTVAGERVCVSGLLTWVNERGELQLVAEEVTPVGAGAVAAMVAESRRRLAADGLLERPRRPLPRLPELIGVVCGADAAVRKDIESVVTARFPGYPVDFAETVLSGPGAAVSILSAVESLAQRPGMAVIILARGGGDPTQLLPFSDEDLCRAIAACPVPVVSAIGHEGDRPLCDDVADLRFGTPSLAAAAVVPDHAGLVRELVELRLRAAGAVGRLEEVAVGRLGAIDTGAASRAGVALASGRLGHAADQLPFVHPRRQLAETRRRLGAVDWRGPTGRRVETAGRRFHDLEWRAPLGARVATATERITADRRHLSALSPSRVLERGYAVVRRPDGRIVRGAHEVAPGQAVDVQLAAGRLTARVEETTNG